MSKLIKSDGSFIQASAHTAPQLERETARVHRVKHEEDKATLEARIRRECETMYTSRIAEAYQQGFMNGKSEGIGESAAEAEAYKADLAGRADELMGSIGEQHAQLREIVEETVVRLSLEIASRLIKREIELSSPVVGQIREAIKRILGVEKVKIKINRADEELVRSQKTELHQAADSVKEFVLDMDDKISAGGCILESELGNVDARLETQMKQIELALRDHTRS
ncbi:MAG TPA: FliH/SctL family protein [Bacteroidota bacterium]|nr:FliH/SctL family protein [Bacteroidota bacterium]